MKFDADLLKQVPVLGIIRGISEDRLAGVFDSARDAGLKFLEITLNTDHALNLIASACQRYESDLCVGAGTVRTRKQAEQAVSAGARFVVSPSLNLEVAAFCRERKYPYFPGALTPTEIDQAWQAGAAMVKVFPASQFGPQYIREIRGPFDDIPLMAVGGVTADNISDYFSAGASAVAVGGSVFSTSRMVSRDYSSIHNHLKEILIAVKKNMNTMK